MEIYRGAPREREGRTEREMRVYEFLDDLEIEYERVDHAKADTMRDCAEVDKALGVSMCKNLFLCNRQKTMFYLLMLPADKPFKTKDLSAQIGSSRLSFADAEQMERYLGISPGAVSVMGLMNDKENMVQLIVDREVFECEYIACHPCVNTSSLKIKTKDVLGKFLENVGHNFITAELER